MGGPAATPVALSVVFPALAITAVGFRLYARHLKALKLQSDDYMILPSLTMVLGLATLGFIGAFHGNFGKHQTTDPNGFRITPSDIVTFNKILYATRLLFVIALTCTKLSILHLYRRIFSNKIFHIAVWAMYGITVSWGISFFLVNLLRCIPISYAWMAIMPPHHCINLSANYANAVTTIVTDLMILVMPLPLIWNLQMPTRQKITVSGMFLLGALVTGISVARAVSFHTIGDHVVRDHDVIYDQTEIFYWILVESSLAVVSACLPTLRPVFHGLSFDSIRSRISTKPSAVGTSQQSKSPHQSRNYARNTGYNESSLGFSKMSTDGSMDDQVTSIQMDDLDAQDHASREETKTKLSRDISPV